MLDPDPAFLPIMSIARIRRPAVFIDRV